MISALWYAGHPKGEEMLRYYADQIVGPELKAHLEKTLVGDRALDDPQIYSRRGLYLKWGVFLATGDESVLRVILTSLSELEELNTQDRWWLACAAATHERVLALCQSEVSESNLLPADIAQLVIQASQVIPSS